MNIGKAIKELREQKGYNQNNLAKEAGITANTMCNIENNKTFSWTTIMLICKKLNVSIAYLMLLSLERSDFKDNEYDNVSKILTLLKKTMSKKNLKAPKKVKIGNFNIELGSSTLCDRVLIKNKQERDKLKSGELVSVDMSKKYGVKTIQIMSREKAIEKGYITINSK